jgi:hypothetical protein
MPFTILRRAASRRACQVASPRRATRSTAREIVLRVQLKVRVKFWAKEAERLNGGTFADSPEGFRLDNSFRIV